MYKGYLDTREPKPCSNLAVRTPPGHLESGAGRGHCDVASAKAPESTLKGTVSCVLRTQRAQYPLIKEYGLNYIELHITI